MARRWRILALLFVVRTKMAFQFQAVGALSPAFQQSFGVSIVDIGLLIGLFFAPGIVISVPGGVLGGQFGAKNIVLIGLAFLTVGGVMMTVSEIWAGQIAGRLIAGIGGILLNVLMTKMVADWFSGKEISFSLAVFVISWPVGIATALILLPIIQQTHGLKFALAVVAMLSAAGLTCMAFLYRSPAIADNARSSQPASGGVQGTMLGAVIAAGAI